MNAFLSQNKIKLFKYNRHALLFNLLKGINNSMNRNDVGGF